MNHVGIVRHAGGPDFADPATFASGRCVAAAVATSPAGKSAENTLRNDSTLTYWSTPPGNLRSTIVDGPSREPGNRAKMSIWLSPSSGATAAMYTSAFTLGTPTAALVITAPPYEWPTSTIGPSIVFSTLLRYAASEATPRSGLAGARTSYPRRRKRPTTASQPLASVNAPCSTTIVGRAREPLRPAPSAPPHPSSTTAATTKATIHVTRRRCFTAPDG